MYEPGFSTAVPSADGGGWNHSDNHTGLPAIKSASLWRVALPLKTPLLLQSGPQDESSSDLSVATGLAAESKIVPDVLSQREIGWLLLQFNDGQYALGEIAPLPGFSKETLAQAVTEVKKIIRRLFDRDEPSCPSAITLSESPSVQFALEMIRLTRCFKVEAVQQYGQDQAEFSMRQTLARLLNGLPAAIHSKSAKLIKPSVDVSQPDARYPAGATVKIKVARDVSSRGVQADITRVNRFARNYPDVHLRLDANCGWTLDQASQFLSSCRNIPLEFIEEPCRNWRESLLLAKEWPVAFDETLQDKQIQPLQFITMAEQLTVHSGAKNRLPVALVCKPSLLGKRCNDWLNIARQREMRIIISASYESPAGLAFLDSLAQFWSPDEIHGLDTLDAFQSITSEDLIATAGEPVWRIS
jgi:o-succinylbenzoate synthase